MNPGLQDAASTQDKESEPWSSREPPEPGETAVGADVESAPLGIRRDASIFAIDGGWFRARWHFSSSEYNDPENMDIGTLRVFNHDALTELSW